MTNTDLNKNCACGTELNCSYANNKFPRETCQDRMEFLFEKLELLDKKINSLQTELYDIKNPKSEQTGWFGRRLQ